jgi:hypothetical protein
MIEENGNGEKIGMHERVARMEVDIMYIKSQVSNHIPHQIDALERKVIEFERMYRNRMWWFLSLFITNLIAVIFILLHDKI